MIETSIDRGSIILFRPIGELDREKGVSLRHLIHGSLAPGAEIVIDMSRVGFVDAAGLSALVRSVRLVKAFGGTVRTCNVRPRIQRLMELIGVDRLLMGAAAPGARRDAFPASRPA
jgi:anti-anti-sigma factor